MKTRVAKSKSTPTQLYLRLPENAHAELAAMAKAAGRSLNSLLVELLTEKIEAHRAAQIARDGDPLLVAYYAADKIALYADVVRAATLMSKIDDGSLKLTKRNLQAVKSLAPELLKPQGAISASEDLTPQEKELLSKFRTLGPDLKAAISALVKKK